MFPTPAVSVCSFAHSMLCPRKPLLPFSEREPWMQVPRLSTVQQSPSCPFPPSCLHVQCHPGWNELLKRELCSNTPYFWVISGLKISPSPYTGRDDTLQSEHLGP